MQTPVMANSVSLVKGLLSPLMNSRAGVGAGGREPSGWESCSFGIWREQACLTKGEWG